MDSRLNHVALFLPNLNGGGAEKVLLNLAIGMTEVGIKTDLVLASAEGEYISQVPANIPIVDLKSKKVRFCVTRLAEYLDHNSPDVMLSALSHANVAAILASKLSRSKSRIAIGIHVNYSKDAYGSGRRGIQIWPTIAKYLYPKSDRIIAVSQGVADDLAQLFRIRREKIDVVYNPVVTPDIFVKATEPVRHPWFEEKNRPIVIGSGRLTRQKDFGTLIRAFSEVRESVDARLVILGEGEDREALQSLIGHYHLEEHVHMPGFVPNPFAYLQKSDLFVLSSGWEGFGNVIVEALALGIPVVSTDCESGPREILENGKYGKLVTVGDWSGMAEAVRETLSTPLDSHRVAELKARGGMFTHENSVLNYLKVLR